MGRPHKSLFLTVGNWLGRKFIALVLFGFLVLLSGIFAPDKCGTITLALVGLYTAFVGGHTTTDVMTRKTTPAAQVAGQVVTAAAQPKKEQEDAD